MVRVLDDTELIFTFLGVLIISVITLLHLLKEISFFRDVS